MADNLMDLYLDPCLIKANALDDLSSRLAGDDIIVDANSVPMFLMEKMSTFIADSVQGCKEAIEVLYKQRANTIEDLHKHMSSYDFLGVYATPAPFEITVLMEKQYIIHNAKSLDDNYQQIIFPVNTIFTLGSYNFGIYYPIVLKINKNTNAIIAYYDTTDNNPLYTIDENALDISEVKQSGLKWIRINIPVYQFDRATTYEAITPESAFVKVKPYTDSFYAMRIYSYIDNAWSPLEVTQSTEVYDIETATAQFVVDTDESVVQISIPPIYFTKNLIGNRLKIEIYTTKGELDVEVSSIAINEVSANFNITDEDTYSAILERMEGFVISPTLDTITGGTNGITFSELRKRVVTNSFQKSVLTSISELEAYFDNLGFTCSRLECNVTNMIFLCHKQLTNSFGNIIAAGFVKTHINNDLVESCTLTIKENMDGSVTIMPNAIFSYDDVNNLCIPLTDTEYTALSIKNSLDKINAYNSNVYMQQPYHVRLERGNQYPVAYTYDLNQPTTSNLTSLGENLDADVQVTIDAVAVTHDGLNGYDIRLMLNFIGSFTTDDVTVYFYTDDKSGVKVGALATFDRIYDTKYIYNIHVDTDYSLFKDNSIYLTSLTNDSNSAGAEVPLSFTATFVTLIKSSVLASTALNPNIGYQVPSSIKSTYTALSEQSSDLVLGKYLSGLYNDVDVAYKTAEYRTYGVDVYLTADRDIYRTNDDGSIYYEINPATNQITYVKIYSVNEYIKHDIDFINIEGTVTSATDNTIVDSSKNFVTDQYRGYQVHITDGTGKGQWRPISNIHDQTIVVTRDWDVVPDDTSTYEIVDRILLHAATDYVYVNGEPVVINATDLDYYVQMLHLDAKLNLVTNINYTNIMTYTRKIILSYMNVVSEATKSIIENTKLFFRPIKTIGSTTSYIGNNTTYKHNLELTMAFKLYVYDYVLKDATIQNNIYNNIVNIIDTYTSSSSERIIAMDVIVSQIKENLSDYIININSLGFFGDPVLQTLRTTSVDTKPHLRQYLVLEEDSTISVARGLTLEYATM